MKSPQARQALRAFHPCSSCCRVHHTAALVIDSQCVCVARTLHIYFQTNIVDSLVVVVAVVIMTVIVAAAALHVDLIFRKAQEIKLTT